MDAILTLEVPDLGRDRRIIVAATRDCEMLLAFRRHLLHKCEIKLRGGDDEVAQRLYQLDYERLKQALDMVIPDSE